MTRRDEPSDRYVAKRVLGEGGAGRVSLVEDRERPGQELALKELQERGSAQHEDAFRREFATLASLHHPNFVEVLEFGTSPASGNPRFTLEFVSGRDITSAVAAEGPSLLPDLTAEALRALAFLHGFDLLHRDLKPANLLVRDQPKLGCRLVIVDFGLVLRSDSDPAEAFRPAGTLSYLAPELLENRTVSRRSDLYGLGAVLFEVVFGRPLSALVPDASGGVRETQGDRVTLPPLPAGYPDGLSAWLAEMLAPEPERRPASATEALARFNEFCGTRYPLDTPATRAARLMSGPPAERTSTLDQIRSVLEPASGPRVVWICGGPGSGKSRVLRWLDAEGILRGFDVVSMSSHPTRALDDLRRSAAKTPTLLIVDEMHDASAELIDLVGRIAREGDAAPIQVVAALRADSVTQPGLRDLVRATGTIPTLRRVDLPKLDLASVRAMASRAAGGAVSDEQVRWLLDTSGGSPVIAESLLIDEAWEKGRRVRAEASAPGPWARLELISKPTIVWLTALAVLRRGARDRHLSALSGLSTGSIRAASDEALAAGLAYPKDGRWVLDSGSLADQLLGALDPERRREIHAVAARLLESDPVADKTLIPMLWLEAGDRERAEAAHLDAAGSCGRASDPAAAAAHYGDALRLMGRRREGRGAVRRAQAEMLMRGGLHADAVRAAGAAARWAESDAVRAEALDTRAEALAQSGRFEAALEVAGRAAARAKESGNAAALARARRTAGIGMGRLGQEKAAIPILEEARELFRECGDVQGEADALHAVAACRARLQEPRAETDFVEAIELYARVAASGSSPREGQDLKARIGLAVMRSRTGRFDEAETLLEAVRHEARERGLLGIQELALSKLVAHAIDTGKLDLAIAQAKQAADLALHLGDVNLIVVNRCGLSDARIRCGRAGEAVAALRATLDAPTSQVEPEIVDYARMLLADALMESGAGEDAEVRALLATSLDGCRARGKRRALMMALVIEMERTARAEGTDAFTRARAEYDAAAAREREPVEPEIGIRAALAASAFHLARASWDAARRQALEAIALAKARGYLAFQARATALLAAVLERSGNVTEGDRAADEGRKLLEAAAGRIADDEVRAGFLDRPVYAPLRSGSSASFRRSETRLVTLYDMIRVLNSESDADALLETILDLALRAVDAERGMIFLREDREGPEQGQFSVHLSRNLEQQTVKDAETFSRRIVEAAGAGRSLLALDAGNDERFRDLKSVSLYQIRSLMCVPLRSRGRVIGTVYLDSRKDGRLFTQDDLRFVEALADQAALAIENTRMRVRLERENRHLAAAAEARLSFGNLVGRSPGMRAVFSLIEKVAGTDLPVLVRGESGTGKELVARAIHAHGQRRRRPFLAENCAALPEALLEAELFGHVRGAFTGAERNRTGLFEQAHGGSLFLDEVGDMSAAMQVRLLRVVEDGAIRPVGGDKAVPVDVRLITATHRDLQKEIKAGRFRLDLLYRLQVLTIELPPLRERPGDIPLLCSHILEKIAGERGREPATVDDDVMALFTRYHWPGNVRELQNTLQRLSLLAGARSISSTLIASDPGLRRVLIPGAEGGQPATFSLRAGEKEQLRQAIAAAAGNRSKAAGLLGISRATFYRKLREHKV